MDSSLDGGTTNAGCPSNDSRAGTAEDAGRDAVTRELTGFPGDGAAAEDFCGEGSRAGWAASWFRSKITASATTARMPPAARKRGVVMVARAFFARESPIGWRKVGRACLHAVGDPPRDDISRNTRFCHDARREQSTRSHRHGPVRAAAERTGRRKVSPFVRSQSLIPRSQSCHEAEIRAAETTDVGQDHGHVGRADAEPFGERGGIFVGRDTGNP